MGRYTVYEKAYMTQHWQVVLNACIENIGSDVDALYSAQGSLNTLVTNWAASRDELMSYGPGCLTTQDFVTTGTNQAAIEDALAAIGVLNRTLVGTPGNYPITDNLSFPANCQFAPENGFRLQVASGKTVTFNGPIKAGNYRWIELADATSHVVFNNFLAGNIGSWLGNGKIGFGLGNNLSALDLPADDTARNDLSIWSLDGVTANNLMTGIQVVKNAYKIAGVDMSYGTIIAGMFEPRIGADNANSWTSDFGQVGIYTTNCILPGATGILTNAFGMVVNCDIGGMTITNRYGIKLESPYIHDGGAITNLYGIYIADQADAVESATNIVSKGRGKNVFEGPVGLANATNPTFALELSTVGPSAFFYRIPMQVMEASSAVPPPQPQYISANFKGAMVE